jgi:hypothetical protein
MTFSLLLTLLTACAEPQHCDDLCESSGFEGIDELQEGCFCSAPNGLGGAVSQEACENYCVATGGAVEDATVENTNGVDDTCLCASEG